MGLYQKQLFGTDGFVILTEGKGPGHLTRLDDKGAFPREYARLFTAAPDLLEALRQIKALPGEINVNNYDHDDVCALNASFIEAYQIAVAAISRALTGGEGK